MADATLHDRDLQCQNGVWSSTVQLVAGPSTIAAPKWGGDSGLKWLADAGRPLKLSPHWRGLTPAATGKNNAGYSQGEAMNRRRAYSPEAAGSTTRSMVKRR